MGKRSVKKDKNIYQICREEADLTREKASLELEHISADRIEKIENERSMAHPDEILAMATCYKRPELCNYYCSHECPIGRENIPEIQMKDLTQITLEMLASLNSLEQDKNRFIEIAADGRIDEHEYRDFVLIKDKIDKISMTVNSLQLWLDNTIANGKINKDMLDAIRKEMLES